jgi:enoyl-CoA hydratase/carnithine racemase
VNFISPEVDLDQSIALWSQRRPPETLSFKQSGAAHRTWFEVGQAIFKRLPNRPKRAEVEQNQAMLITETMSEARSKFVRIHGGEVYRALRKRAGKPLRVEDLAYAAGESFPGLVPTRQDVLQELALPQKEKEGIELAQGILFSEWLRDEETGNRIMRDMRLAKEESLALFPEFERAGFVDLGQARIRRANQIAHVEMCNTQFLNAEDDGQLEALETCVDLALLDPRVQLGVLRGARMKHPKYLNRRVFCSGLNLTHLADGKLSFLFYISHELGLVSKLYRGLATEAGLDVEKPWVAAVEGHAIGGGCQLLLVMDYVLIEDDAFISLPARKEGFIPGAANLRLPRFLGERAARQAIFCNRVFMANSPDCGRLVDEVVPVGSMDAALDRALDNLLHSGIVGMASNRRAFREGEEPLSLFRSYMATFSVEQAQCHFSPALITNLERSWTNRNSCPTEK